MTCFEVIGTLGMTLRTLPTPLHGPQVGMHLSRLWHCVGDVTGV